MICVTGCSRSYEFLALSWTIFNLLRFLLWSWFSFSILLFLHTLFVRGCSMSLECLAFSWTIVDLLWLFIRSWFFFSVSSYSHVLCAVTSFCIRIPSGRHYESHFFVNGDLLLLSVFLPWVSVERTINATYYTSILVVQALLIMFKPQLVDTKNSTFLPTSPTSKVISLYHLSISNIVILMILCYVYVISICYVK